MKIKQMVGELMFFYATGIKKYKERIRNEPM